MHARSYGLEPYGYSVPCNLPSLLYRKPILLNLQCSRIAFEHSSPVFDLFIMGETPGKMYALATVLILLAATAVLLRLYARKIKKASLAWDDYMILFAMVGRVPRGLYLLSCNLRTDKGGSSCLRLVPRCACSLVRTCLISEVPLARG